MKNITTLIIAEAGVNHNGDLSMAKRLIEVAAEAGADYVKFQTFNSKYVVTSTAKQAGYQTKNTGINESQLDMISRLELSQGNHFELIEHSKKIGIKFLSTGFDLESIEFLSRLNLGLFKIPSGEITNLPYLRQIGSYGKPIVLSTGMSSLGEIEAAIDVLEQAGTSRSLMTVLHCTTEYPTPMVEVNLRAMQCMQAAFGVSVGYSDHTAGIEIAIAAAALGATVIEKHFTLDKKLPGPDHKASLEPDELKAMVSAIRNIEVALGDGIKRLTPSEARNKPVARKSLVASKTIKAGELLSADNITTKRPGTGISPMKWDAVIGRKAVLDFAIDELIEL
jgi:N,N'-diacetyllegionaminate synthase